MINTASYKAIGTTLRVIGHPKRIRILLEIGTGEVCVCHLEAQLGMRQAYLSQQLMALRDADILQTNKEGRFIYYRIADHKILDLITYAALINGISIDAIPSEKKICSCPKCCDEG